MAQAYCVKDKMKVEVQNPQMITMKNGKPALSGTCIVLHSDRSEAELEAAVQRCGADGYMRKTCEEEDLIEQVSKWVRGARQPVVASDAAPALH